MTIDEWKALKRGDVLIDKSHQGKERRVLSVSRHQSKNSTLTRTGLTVVSLKQPGATTIIFETENTGPYRFDLVRRSP